MNHAPQAIFVDLTAPIAGSIYHGMHLGYHSLYQWEGDRVCVVWRDFHDPDSGISEEEFSYRLHYESLSLLKILRPSKSIIVNLQVRLQFNYASAG